MSQMPGVLNENEINNGVARYWLFGTGIVALVIGLICAMFTVGCYSGCQERPLTTEQEYFAHEIAKAKTGDFVTTADSILFVTDVFVMKNSGAPGLNADFCPGMQYGAVAVRDIARWKSPLLITRGSEKYLETLDAWINKSPDHCYN